MFKNKKVKNVQWTTLMKVFFNGPKGLKASHKKHVYQSGVCPRFVANPCGQAKSRILSIKKALIYKALI